MWHAQITSVTLRLFREDQPTGYAKREKWLVIAQAELLGDRLAYVHAASGLDGKEVTISQWRRLAAKLFKEHGILYMLIERTHKYIWIDTQTGEFTRLDLPEL